MGRELARKSIPNTLAAGANSGEGVRVASSVSISGADATSTFFADFAAPAASAARLVPPASSTRMSMSSWRLSISA